MTTPILSAQQWNLEILDSYDATIVEMPFGLDPRNPLREHFDDRSVGVHHGMGSIRIIVCDAGARAIVAIAVFGADAGVVRCDTIEVSSLYRRKGVAMALYQLASCIFEAPVVRSHILSPDAVLFWGNRTQIVCP